MNKYARKRFLEVFRAEMHYRIDSRLWRKELLSELIRLGLFGDYDEFCLSSCDPEHQYALELLGRYIRDSLIELLREANHPSTLFSRRSVDSIRDTMMDVQRFIASCPDSLHYDNVQLLRQKALKSLARQGVRFDFFNKYRDEEAIRLMKSLYGLINKCKYSVIYEDDVYEIREIMEDVGEFIECYSDSSHYDRLALLRAEAITVMAESGIVLDRDEEHVVSEEIRFFHFDGQSRGKYNDAQRIEDSLLCPPCGCVEYGYELDSIPEDDIPDSINRTPDEMADAMLVKEHVQQMVDALPPKERVVIKLRYGIQSPRYTLAMIGNVYNINQTAVRMRELAALKRLKLIATGEDMEWVGVKPHRKRALARLRKSALFRIIPTEAKERKGRKNKADAIRLESIAREANIPLSQVLNRYRRGVSVDMISKAYTPAPWSVLNRLVLFRNKWVLSVNELLGVIGCGEQTLAEVMDRNGLNIKWSHQNTIKGLEYLIGKVTDLGFEEKVAMIGVAKEEYIADSYNLPDECLKSLVFDERTKRRVRLRTIVARLGVCNDDLRLLGPRSKIGNEAIANRPAAWMAGMVASRIYAWAQDPVDLKWLPNSKEQE